MQPKRRSWNKPKKHREKVLAEIKLVQTNTGKLTTGVVPKSILELEEEAGFTCKICREGYSFKPEEILGIYTFTKRANLAQINAGGRTEPGYSTVTYLTTVHFSCHREATKAERTMKVPKEEWEGATLRNSQTKCNNLFPIQGPQITDEVYATCLNKFWTNMNNVARCESTRFRLIAHDMKFLLLRFAKEESFSVDSKGGGRESNIKLIPFFIQMGLFLLDQKEGAQRRVYEKALSQFVTQSNELWITSSLQADNVCYMLVLSLFLHSIEEWEETRLTLLKRILLFAFMEDTLSVAESKKTGSSSVPPIPSTAPSTSTSASAPSTSSGGPPSPQAPHSPPSAGSTSQNELDSDFRICRPMLIYFILIDKLQYIFKKKSGIPVTPTSIASASHKIDQVWIVEMKKNLKNNSDKDLMDQMRELLSNYEQFYLMASNFMEFFDDLGLLSQILTDEKTAEDWVKRVKETNNMQET